MGEQSFHEDQELVDLLDKFADGCWERWRPFCEVFLDSIWGLVGCQIKVGFFLSLLFLNAEGLQANCKDADTMMAGFIGWSWG